MSTEAGDAAVVHVVALWRAEPDRLEPVREVLRELAAATRREPGCLRFEVLEATDRPGSFVLVERYAGADGHAAHTASAHFRELVLGRAVPMLAHRDVRTYQVLDPEEGSASA
jgi:quinol monooxygenase YgiN